MKRKNMNRTYLALMVAALFATVNVVSAEEAALAEKSFGGMVVGTEQFSAKVKKIDQQDSRLK